MSAFEVSAEAREALARAVDENYDDYAPIYSQAGYCTGSNLADSIIADGWVLAAEYRDHRIVRTEQFWHDAEAECRAVQERLDAVLAVIEKAPHAVGCEGGTWMAGGLARMRACSCWKSSVDMSALAAHDAETRRQAAREWADRIYDEWPGGTGHEGLGVQWAEDWLRALAEKGADRG